MNKLKDAAIAVLNEAKEQNVWHNCLNKIRDGYENYKYVHVPIRIDRLIQLEAAVDLSGEWLRVDGGMKYKVGDEP